MHILSTILDGLLNRSPVLYKWIKKKLFKNLNNDSEQSSIYSKILRKPGWI